MIHEGCFIFEYFCSLLLEGLTFSHTCVRNGDEEIKEIVEKRFNGMMLKLVKEE
jgi:hypothetical protein